jgi:hypothetical protein
MVISETDVVGRRKLGLEAYGTNLAKTRHGESREYDGLVCETM